jgi:hypothetical protein
VKKLCALLVIGGLFALGCGGSPTTKKPITGTGPGTHETPKGGTPSKKEAVEKTPKLESISAEGAAIAADKGEAEVVIEVAAENVDGDITVTITPPPELKVDKDTVTIKKGEKSAKVKVSVPDTTKRDKDQEYKLGLKASADKAKDLSKDVAVKVEKKK